MTILDIPRNQSTEITFDEAASDALEIFVESPESVDEQPEIGVLVGDTLEDYDGAVETLESVDESLDTQRLVIAMLERALAGQEGVIESTAQSAELLGKIEADLGKAISKLIKAQHEVADALESVRNTNRRNRATIGGTRTRIRQSEDELKVLEQLEQELEYLLESRRSLQAQIISLEGLIKARDTAKDIPFVGGHNPATKKLSSSHVDSNRHKLPELYQELEALDESIESIRTNIGAVSATAETEQTAYARNVEESNEHSLQQAAASVAKADKTMLSVGETVNGNPAISDAVLKTLPVKRKPEIEA